MNIKRDQFGKLEDVSEYDKDKLTDREIFSEILHDSRMVEEELTKRHVASEETKKAIEETKQAQMKWETIIKIGVPIATSISEYFAYKLEQEKRNDAKNTQSTKKEESHESIRTND